MKSGWKWFWYVVAFLLVILAGFYLIVNVEIQDLDLASKKTAPGEFILLPEGEVHYRLVGEDDEPLVVLVHGFSVPSYVWDPTLSALHEAGYQVLVYDLFGRGYSERLKCEYDIDLFTNQLSGLILALEIEMPFVVGGLSMGGPIAARFAHQHPDMVSGVLLISPVVTRPTRGETFPLNVPLVGEYLMRAVMEPFVLPRLQTADFFNPANFPDWEDRYRAQLKFKGTGQALLSTIRNLIRHDPGEEYQALEMTGTPLLLIWGEEDQTIGWTQIEILKEMMPEIQVKIVPAAGHLSHFEQPSIVNPVIIQFLEEVTGIDD